VQDSLAACGFETRSQIIWAKNNFAIGRGHYHCKHDAMTDTNKNGRDKSREALRQREAGTRRLRSTPSQHQPAPTPKPKERPASKGRVHKGRTRN